MSKFFRQHSRQPVHCESEPFARGQEGEVSRTKVGTIIKRFFEPTLELEQKLEVMRQNPPPRPIRHGLGWPRALIVDEHSCFRGYEAAYFADHYSLADVLDLTNRAASFPHWSFEHSITLARNLADILGRIHEHALVVGDMNPDNFLFDNFLVAAAVDLDSAQIRGPRGLVFPSRRSTPSTTAPEVLEASARGTECRRTLYQDYFGLAVLVFELVLGWHPYAGTFIPAAADRSGFPPNIEQRMRSNWWAYADFYAERKATTGEPSVRLPRYGLRLDSLPTNCALLFNQAFNVGYQFPERRPSPKRFMTAFDELLDQLRTCQTDPNHSYYRGLSVCPWCEAARQGGTGRSTPTHARQ